MDDLQFHILKGWLVIVEDAGCPVLPVVEDQVKAIFGVRAFLENIKAHFWHCSFWHFACCVA